MIPIFIAMTVADINSEAKERIGLIEKSICLVLGPIWLDMFGAIVCIFTYFSVDLLDSQTEQLGWPVPHVKSTFNLITSKGADEYLYDRLKNKAKSPFNHFLNFGSGMFFHFFRQFVLVF
jgi:hypothetical protein